MLRVMIAKEIREQVKSSRFALLAILGVVFLGAGFTDGALGYLERLDTYRVANAASAERLRRIIDADERFIRDRYNWGEFTYKGYQVHRPPSPLSSLVQGLDPVMGSSIQIRGVDSQPFRRPGRSALAEDPLLAIFPPLDPAGIAQTVLSLLILLLSYDAFCGEKQDGMLRLVGSFAVPAHRLLLAKFIGILLPVLAAFLVPSIAGVGILSIHPDIALDGEAWIRIGLIGLTTGGWFPGGGTTTSTVRVVSTLASPSVARSIQT